MDPAALVRAVEALMSPLEWDGESAWLAECLRRVREARGIPPSAPCPDPCAELEAVLRLPGDEPGWLRAALNGSAHESLAPRVHAGDELHAVMTLRRALAAGLAALWRLEAWRSTIGRALDEVETGLAIYTGDGLREVARNTRLDELLHEEPGRERLAELVARQARLAAAPGAEPTQAEVELAGGSYRLVASRAAAGTLLPGAAVLVLLERLSAALPTTQELRITFGLRGREPQVALLAAEGLSNAAIAQRLRLSSHTVRHYLERVLDRLGLHSRTALAVRLMSGGERPPPERRLP